MNFFKKLFSRGNSAPSTNPEIGKSGEEAAQNYLRRQGFSILERNWKCLLGEMDLICRDHDTIVFVEVKSSLKLGMVSPEYRVGSAKQKKLRSLAAYYLKHVGTDSSCRFDVIAVWWNGNAPQVRHIQNAFE